MENHIGIRDLRGNLAAVIQEVRESGTTYIVERSGEAIVAVIPLAEYELLKASKNQADKLAGTGPYDELLSLAGTMKSTSPGVSRNKNRHLAEIYSRRK